MGNCLKMHVVYFRRTSYGIPSLGSTMRDQDSIDYLVIQLFISHLLGLCPDYGPHQLFFCVGLWSSVIRALRSRPASVPRMLDRGTGHTRYPFKTNALHRQALQQ